jgi:uncharacterized protein YgbK (DUF1537 family)
VAYGLIGVIADDITGANDIGNAFTKWNWVTKVYGSWFGRDPHELASGADVLVLDTDSRYDNPQMAAQKVKEATQVLRSLSCDFYYKKCCSAFRGNIGCEFDAFLAALDEQFSLVVAAYPQNGRTTINGKHFIHNKLLECSSLAHDPVNPTTTSDLLQIISATSSRSASLLPLSVIRTPKANLEAYIESLQNSGKSLFVCDAVLQQDLRKIAAVVAHMRVFCGSASLAEELPAFWSPKPKRNLLEGKKFQPGKGALVVAGSITKETKAQIDAARGVGILTLSIDTRALINPNLTSTEVDLVSLRAAEAIENGRHVIIHTSNDSDSVRATRKYGLQIGLDLVEVSKSVSHGVAMLTERVVSTTGTERIILAGGDTAASVCRELGVIGNWVLDEIQPGIPSALAIGRSNFLLVLKSGSFGDASFFVSALHHLEGLTQTVSKSCP